MRRTLIAATAIVFAALAGDATAAELKTDDQKVLYALGLAIGNNLSVFSLSEAELKLVSEGLADSVLHRKPEVDLQTYGPKIKELQQSRMAAAATVEKKSGQSFVAKAAAEKGAAKTKGGAVVKAVKVGTGASPTARDKVKVHYHGTLTDGTVFDSSVQRGEPVTFPLEGVIPCWTEGLQQMKVGGKYRLVCPSELAYGDRGAPPRIKPGATLVFEVELLEIAK